MYVDVRKIVKDEATVYAKREGVQSLKDLLRSFGVKMLPDLTRAQAARLAGILGIANYSKCDARRENGVVMYRTVSPSVEVPPPPESVLQEAQRITQGDRAAAYGHPLDGYTRTAALVSALLADKLKEPITAHEMALAMCCVKLSREMHRQKRDNLVDLAGYSWVAHAILEETERRKVSQP